MILYHAITTYHLLEFMVHKLRYHENEEAVCILPDFICEKFTQIDDLVAKNIFTDVIVFSYKKIQHNKDTILTQTGEIVNSVLSDIESFSEINVAGGQYYFAHWLTKNNIPFNFFEEASGTLTKSESLKNIVKNISQIQYELALEDGMFDGNNPVVSNKYCNFNAQTDDFIDEKAIHFDVVEELSSLERYDLLKILSFFKVPDNLTFEQDSVMILTQHFANLNMMSFEEQAALYQLTVDYYTEEKNIIYKTHPDDVMFYELLTSDCKVIREKFPSELLPFISNEAADTALAISSTGIYNISQFYKKVINFNVDYEHSFNKNHSYYFFLKLIENFKYYEQYNYYALGVNQIQLEHLKNHGDISINNPIEYLSSLDIKTSKNIIIIDDISKTDLKYEDVIQLLYSISDDSIVYFVNSNKEYYFYDYFNKAIFDNIVLKKMKKNITKQDIYADVAPEMLHIFTKNSKLRKELQNMNYEKNLVSTGIQTKVPKTSDDETRIAVLEGILEATEKRLLYYINREKELLTQLNSK